MKPAPPVISIVFDIRLFSLGIFLASGERGASLQVPIVLKGYDLLKKAYDEVGI
jgi:hypothetical protein